MTLSAEVRSTSGSISVLADDDVQQLDDGNAGAAGNGNIATTGDGSIDVRALNLEAGGGADGISMSQYTSTLAARGNIRYEAANAGDIRAALIRTAGPLFGDVSLNAAGSILDANDPLALNIAGDQLRLSAGGSIGTSTNLLEIDGHSLAAVANTDPALPVPPASRDGMYLREQQGLTVETVAPVSVNRVQQNGTTVAAADAAALAGLQTQGHDGNIVLVLDGSNLLIDAAVTANQSGNVLLQTLAADGDITIRQTVSSGSGAISIIAGDDVAQLTATGNLSTGGTIDVWAQNATSADAGRGIQMDAATSSQAGGNIRYQADNGGDLRMAQLSTPADIAVNVGGSVLDSNGGTVNFTANQVRVAAGGSIGTAADALESNITTLAAESNTAVAPLPNPPGAGEGIYWYESGTALTVDAVAPVAANRVAADGSAPAVQDPAALAGVRAGDSDRDILLRGNGDFVSTAAGDIVTRGGDVRICFTGSGTLNGDVLSGGDPAAVPGGLIQVIMQTGLTVNSMVSSEMPPSPGTGALMVGPGVTFTGAAVLRVGAGNVVLDGGGLDLIIATPLSLDFHTVLYARRDVIVDNVAVSTTAGHDLVLEADQDGAGQLGRLRRRRGPRRGRDRQQRPPSGAERHADLRRRRPRPGGVPAGDGQHVDQHGELAGAGQVRRQYRRRRAECGRHGQWRRAQRDLPRRRAAERGSPRSGGNHRRPGEQRGQRRRRRRRPDHGGGDGAPRPAGTSGWPRRIRAW